MNAFFKETTNNTNRFAALKECAPLVQRGGNYFKKDPFPQKEKVEPEKKKKEFLLVESEFPVFIAQPQQEKQSIKKNVVSFIEKVKTVQKQTEITDEDLLVKPGWVSLHQDPQTRKIVWKHGPLKTDISSWCFQPDPEPQPIDVLNALVETHEKQIAYYDMLWGEGAYEQHYRSPYHDYEYFERLDELEEEMEEQ